MKKYLVKLGAFILVTAMLVSMATIMGGCSSNNGYTIEDRLVGRWEHMTTQQRVEGALQGEPTQIGDEFFYIHDGGTITSETINGQWVVKGSYLYIYHAHDADTHMLRMHFTLSNSDNILVVVVPTDRAGTYDVLTLHRNEHDGSHIGGGGEGPVDPID